MVVITVTLKLRLATRLNVLPGIIVNLAWTGGIQTMLRSTAPILLTALSLEVIQVNQMLNYNVTGLVI